MERLKVIKHLKEIELISYFTTEAISNLAGFGFSEELYNEMAITEYLFENNSKKEKEKKEVLDYDRIPLDIERSLQRTKKMVKNYGRNNVWDWFVTLTFDVKKINSKDLETSKKYLKKFTEYYARLGCQYLFIPEYHVKDKKIHFHGLFKGELDTVLITTKGKSFLNASRWVKNGFSVCKRIDNSDFDASLRVASYITKYVTKDLVCMFGKQRYFVSKGLPSGEVLIDRRLYKDEGELQNPTFENAYCKIKRIYLKDIPVYKDEETLIKELKKL